jgi:hypothetical protein
MNHSCEPTQRDTTRSQRARNDGARARQNNTRNRANEQRASQSGACNRREKRPALSQSATCTHQREGVDVQLQETRVRVQEVPHRQHCATHGRWSSMDQKPERQRLHTIPSSQQRKRKPSREGMPAASAAQRSARARTRPAHDAPQGVSAGGRSAKSRGEQQPHRSQTGKAHAPQGTGREAGNQTGTNPVETQHDRRTARDERRRQVGEIARQRRRQRAVPALQLRVLWEKSAQHADQCIARV